MHHPIDMIAHTTAFFYISHGALAGTGNNSIDRPSDEDQHITVGGWEVITTP